LRGKLVKSAYNIQGNLTNLLNAIIAGNLSMEAAQMSMNYLYYWQDLTSASWAFTDAGHNITVPTPFQGNPTITFLGDWLQWERPTIQTNVGAENSKATLICYPCVDSTTLPETATVFFDGVNDGLFDGALIYVMRYITSATQNVSGIVKEWVGWMGQIKASRDKITIEVNSLMQQLNMRIPKRMYSPSCTHALYDAGCTLNKANYTYGFTVGSVDSSYPQQIVHPASYPGVTVGSFQLGAMEFTSGENAGLIRSVKADYGSYFWLSSTLPNTPSIGDHFTVTFGCDKTLITCISRFNNFNNFNGFPFIPAETIFY
jgi:uncharacterized phage protein (TIGR02218 family)